ncbi:MAG: PAS domain S-box protein [Pyrinomonadaceae bacterium]
MTTSPKLWFGFGTLILMLILLSTAIIIRVWSIEGQVNKMAAARGLSATARQLEINTLGYALGVRAYTQTGEPAARQNAFEEAAMVDQLLAEYVKLARSDSQRQMAERFVPLWQELKNLGITQLDSGNRQPSPEDSIKFFNLRTALEKLLDDEIQADAAGRYEIHEQEALRDVQQIVLFVTFLLIVGAIIALITSWLVGKAVVKGERFIAEQAERLKTTLASIGDAVITTDTAGRVTNLNAVAESLTGWTNSDAAGEPLDGVFRIVNEATRESVENPATRALREGAIVGLANHTVLIDKDGTERAIDDSAAPIRCREGEIVGCVLVFRDVTERRQAELARAELNQLVALRADVSSALAGGQELHEALQFCTEALVDHLDVAFARIWTLNESENVLELQASAGLYTHLDGPHSRVKVGEFKIGRIAANRQAHLTNSVPDDPNVSDPEWAKREGMIAFAGYPLIVSDRVVGVMGMFARHPLSDGIVTQLAPLADGIAQFIDRTRANRAMRESEARKTAMFETTLDSIISINHEGTIIEFNASAERTFGHRREDVLGMELATVIIPPVYRDRHRQGMAHYIATGEGPILNKRLELSALRADGTEFPVELTVTRIPVEGSPLFTAYLRDITERKEADDKLRESERRLRFVMDSMPQKIFTATPTGDVDYFNPEWSKFTGLTFEQIREWGWTQFIHPDDVAENIRVWKNSIETGEPFQFEHRFRSVDGEYRWHVSRALAMRDEAGRVSMWVGSNTEIHEQKQAANDLRQLAANLSEADRRKTEFLAMLAHELRNPLAPIRNALEIMRLTGTDTSTSAATDMMERQVGQLVRLVDDLLDVSRISRGKIELRTARIELASSVNHAVEAARPASESGGVQLEVTLPSQPIYLNGDPTRLSQIVGNLLNNACKFTDPGGRVDLIVERVDSEALIRVRDTGIGIEESQIGHVFDMFVQADTSLERASGGLGIGLTLVKNLVELHHGSVEARSEGLGLGSEFVVRLPILDKPLVTKTILELAVDRSTAVPKRRILVVDDNVDSAESLAMLMKISGHEVEMAHDGLEAVDLSLAFRPDVILLDIGLPKLNGYEVARKIREQQAGKDIVLIALTGWGQEEDRRKSKESGFNAHIVKPVDFPELTKLLDSLLSPE